MARSHGWRQVERARPLANRRAKTLTQRLLHLGNPLVCQPEPTDFPTTAVLGLNKWTPYIIPLIYVLAAPAAAASGGFGWSWILLAF